MHWLELLDKFFPKTLFLKSKIVLDGSVMWFSIMYDNTFFPFPALEMTSGWG